MHQQSQSPYLKALAFQNEGPPPIWMMRQAGRYLPEYRAVREKHSFLEMVYTPEVAAEVTLQPIRRFGMDAAILFSDILVTAQALGCRLDFIEKRGPVFETVVRSEQDVNAFTSRLDLLSPIYDTIRLLKQQLGNTPLIGFAGAPFTVAAYMVEGQSSPDLKNFKKLMMTSPQLVHTILSKLTDVSVAYLVEQVKAGADALQIFDTWAIHLDWMDYQAFSLAYIQQVIEKVREQVSVPITVFGKGTGVFAPLIASVKPTAIGLDWNADLSLMRKVVGQKIALQGNLDPYALYASDSILKQKVQSILGEMKGDKGFVFNLGHGLMPDMDPDQVKRVVEWVKQGAAD